MTQQKEFEKEVIERIEWTLNQNKQWGQKERFTITALCLNIGKLQREKDIEWFKSIIDKVEQMDCVEPGERTCTIEDILQELDKK